MPPREALIRRPGPRLAEGVLTYLERSPVELSRAVRQWEAYTAALRAHGWLTHQVEPADDCPDAVFVEDAVVVHRGLALVTHPGAGARRAEPAGVARSLERLGIPVRRFHPPGTLDGGDVLKVGDTLYVGHGGRTDPAGIRQLSDVFAPLGARVVPVPVSRALHLKSTVTALPDGTVLGYRPLMDDPSVFPQLLAVPEVSGSQVVQLGDGRLLIAASAPRTARLLADRGYDPVPVDISEFEKLEGGVTCLSVRLQGAPD